MAKAIRLFGLEHTWDNLHKVLEAVEDAVGGKQALEKKEWVPKKKLKNFRRTANSARAVGDVARHGHEKFDPPAKPMPLEDASELLQTILTRLLDSVATPFLNA